MKSTDQMIEEKELWGGMNRPNMATKDADIAIFGIPYDGSVSFRNGAKAAPRQIRGITYSIPPTTEYFENISDFKVRDLGDVTYDERHDLFEQVEDQVAQLVREDTIFMMIGGDHSTTIPVLRGINKAVSQDFGIIHIDAHFDLCDTLEGDSLSHGSTQRRALELENVSGCDNQYFLGIRSMELNEHAFMQENKVNVISASKFDEIGVKAVLEAVKEKMAPFNKVYITIDIDCLDPGYAAGTGTPQFGGLTPRQLLNLLKGLFDLPVIGFDIVEVAPRLDESLTSVFAARKIITECWGHIWRKNQK